MVSIVNYLFEVKNDSLSNPKSLKTSVAQGALIGTGLMAMKGVLNQENRNGIAEHPELLPLALGFGAGSGARVGASMYGAQKLYKKLTKNKR